MSAIFYYVNNKKLNENQKDPKLHYFIFDHFLFRWLPNSFRKWARFGLINPEFDTVRDTQTETYKIDLSSMNSLSALSRGDSTVESTVVILVHGSLNKTKMRKLLT